MARGIGSRAVTRAIGIAFLLIPVFLHFACNNPSVSDDPRNGTLQDVGSNEPPNDDALDQISDQHESSGDAQPMVTASRNSGAAPLGVFFDASDPANGVVQPPTAADGRVEYFSFHYEWDFGDDPSATWSTTGRPKNQAVGYLGAHVYENPGIYTVRLVVTQPDGTSHTYEQAITATDPDVVFANSSAGTSQRTLYVSSSTGSDSNNGSFNHPLRSWDRGIALLFSGPGPRRVLFRRGETFLTDSTRPETFTGPLVIGAYGVGNDPLIFGIDPHPILFVGVGEDLTVTGLRFASEYDPSTGFGLHPNAISMLWNNTFVTIYDNSFSNLGLNIQIGQQGLTQNAVIAGNAITAWQNYGILSGDFENVAIIGNSIKQDPNARTGDGKLPSGTEPDLPDHGPLRLRDVERVLVSENDLFSNTGWSGGHDENGYAHQACLRMGSGGVVRWCIVSGNRLEGGSGIAGSGPSNSALTAQIGTAIWEKNTFLATSVTGNMYATAMGGVVLRNNVFLRPNFPDDERGIGAILLFDNPAGPQTDENREFRNYIYSNTYVSTESGKDMGNFLKVKDETMLNFTFKNNLMYAPFVRPSSRRAFISWQSTDNVAGLETDHNLLFVPDRIAYADALVDGTQVEYTLEEWQTLPGLKDANSLSGIDPRLIDPQNGMYGLQSVA
ncbi:MAG: PKD domain-containing protein, partial [Chloroflexi bacterium]|nr:PKD domain-containing protein [Chloroflexota bacterium]